MKKTHLLVFTLFWCSMSFSLDFVSGGIAYNVTSPTTVSVVPISGPGSTTAGYSGNIIIPSTVTDTGTSFSYSVTTIAYYAFYNCPGLTSVIIPDSATTIQNFAFQESDDLTSVTIGNSVTTIGNHAFFRCSSLTSVTIPDSVITIGNVAFYECTGLTSVTIGNSVTTIEDQAFYKCAALSSVSIPYSVTYIGGSAFAFCSGLTSISIPNSLTSISGGLFQNCTGLTSVSIPDSVTVIGGAAFQGCNSLTSVSIPDSVTDIWGSAFQDCTSLTGVYVPYAVTTIGNSAFKNCTGLTWISIPVSIIGGSAFQNCTSLTTITIVSSVTSIEDYAFAGCTGLTSVSVNLEIPLDITPSVFDGVPISTIPLYVPSGSEEVYDWTAVWTDFLSPIVMILYADTDGDGYGNPLVSMGASGPIVGFVLDNTDCDDTNAGVNPGATEIAYDGIDNNCDGNLDEGFPLLLTSLRSAVCGTTLPFIYTSVGTPYVPVPGITGYRFKAKNMTTLAEQTIDRGLYNWFRLTQLPVYDYATTYEVSVELQRSGVWLGYYGSTCIITTPGIPIINQCGLTLSAGSALTTTALTGVTQYTFKVTNVALGTFQTFDKPSNVLIVNQIPGYLATTAYSVSVAIKTALGTLSAFGTACEINPAPAARFGNSVEPSTGLVTDFKAVGAPNPFETNFTLSVTTVCDAKVQVAVYDMIGKQLESREVTAQEATALEVGVNYPSGVYNVIVSQGANVKSLRMIKR
jgi:hypothetical protein